MGNKERSVYEPGELRQNDDNINTKDFLIGALVGGLVGAATALFLAPKSGKDIRSNINEQAAILREKTGQLRENAISKGNEIATAAKETTNKITQTVTQQSAELLNRVKGMTLSGQESGNTDDGLNAQISGETDDTRKIQYIPLNQDDIQRKLEETQRAFDETEHKLNH